MQREHIADGWWQLPGKPQGTGRAPRTAAITGCGCRSPRRLLIDAERVRRRQVGAALRKLVAEPGIERATPHDLRRTCLTWITRLGFGRDAMDRIANHRTSTVTDVYDRHGYADEDKRIMAAVARHVIGLVEGTGDEQRGQPAVMRRPAAPASFQRRKPPLAYACASWRRVFLAAAACCGLQPSHAQLPSGCAQRRTPALAPANDAAVRAVRRSGPSGRIDNRRPSDRRRRAPRHRPRPLPRSRSARHCATAGRPWSTPRPAMTDPGRVPSAAPAPVLESRPFSPSVPILPRATARSSGLPSGVDLPRGLRPRGSGTVLEG